jgi:hypothetical protein
MVVRITTFAGEYAQLGAWAGESEADLRAQDGYHEEDRDHFLAWAGDAVVGAVHPWLRPDGRHALYYDRCREDAYAPLAAMIDGPCHAPLDADDATAIGAVIVGGFVELYRP